ncbi:MAG: toxin-activating lysine-acyltransferase [Desulfobulbaceae bacterium]|nr:toxin-activating lysine-acyltransferase [Desulfobulbaceae bacterium]
MRNTNEMADDDRKSSDDQEALRQEAAELHQQIRAQSHQLLKRLPAFGPVLMLYMQSAHRRLHFIADLEWLLLPPLMSEQCKLYMKKEYPISFVSWAFLNEETERLMLAAGGKLRPADWKSGDRLWLIDIVAPFGGVETMLDDIRKNHFPERTIRLIAPDPATGGIKAKELPPYRPDETKEAFYGPDSPVVQ